MLKIYGRGSIRRRRKMAKKDYKIYLEEVDYKKLIQKALECGY